MLTKKEQFELEHWRYYLMLEEKFLKTCQYVELCEDNYKTYSNEYVSLLQLIGAELDIIVKKFCNCNNDQKSFGQCLTDILSQNNNFKNICIILISNRTTEIYPFCEKYVNEFEGKYTPSWWKNYTNIKHHRVEKIKFANLENVLSSLSALYILNSEYIFKVSEKNECDYPTPLSNLFKYKTRKTKYMPSTDICLEIIE